MELERKFCGAPATLGLGEGAVVEGYASVFAEVDRGGDVVAPGAYAKSLAALGKAGRRVKLLWQHDAGEPIGVWDEVREDARGLYVKGRILTDVQRGAEALELLRSGAIDGLSIGYRTVKSERLAGAGRRLLEIDLWEVSVVTFPMMPEARVRAGSADGSDDLAQTLVEAITEARNLLA